MWRCAPSRRRLCESQLTRAGSASAGVARGYCWCARVDRSRGGQSCLGDVWGIQACVRTLRVTARRPVGYWGLFGVLR